MKGFQGMSEKITPYNNQHTYLLGYKTITVKQMLSLLPLYTDNPLEIKSDHTGPAIKIDNIWPFASDLAGNCGVGLSGRTLVGQSFEGVLKYTDWIFVSEGWYNDAVSLPKPKPVDITSEMAPAELLHSLDWSEALCQGFTCLKGNLHPSERLLALKQGYNVEIPATLHQIELLSGMLFVDESLPYAYESLKLLPHNKLFKLFQQYWLSDA